MKYAKVQESVRKSDVLESKRWSTKEEKRKNKKEISYQPRSSPFSRKEQSPLTSQFQPPLTPLPLQSTKGMFSGSSRVQMCCFSTGASGMLRRVNFDNEQVKHLKSSSLGSSGIFPVRARPIQIMLAACVQMSSVLGPAGSWSSFWMT